jgi:hypothetical protein
VIDSADTLTWLLRATFGVLLVVSSAWLVRSWRSEPAMRLHDASHVAMSAGMLYMTLPAAAQPLPVAGFVATYLALAAALVARGVRDVRSNRTSGLDACIGCAPPAAGSVGAAYMFLIPLAGSGAAVVPVALTFGVAAALRGGSALACAVDGSAARSRWINPRVAACGSDCSCAPPCGCAPSTAAIEPRSATIRLATYAAMNVAMAVMLVAMAHPSTPLHQHLG